MVPDDCPYTVRIVSEVLESNGSSSMATVCSGTMALMDAGIQLIKPVSGIAMGLISDGTDYAVLSDILGDEDHLGDMDFKITGTADGITACQMDIKVKGLSYDILVEALKQARDGRLHILDKLNEAILIASTAIQLSDIPFEYPISEVRVARVNGEFVINPSRAPLLKNPLRDVILADSLKERPDPARKRSLPCVWWIVCYGHYSQKTITAKYR